MRNWQKFHGLFYSSAPCFPFVLSPESFSRARREKLKRKKNNQKNHAVYLVWGISFGPCRPVFSVCTRKNPPESFSKTKAHSEKCAFTLEHNCTSGLYGSLGSLFSTDPSHFIHYFRCAHMHCGWLLEYDYTYSSSFLKKNLVFHLILVSNQQRSCSIKSPVTSGLIMCLLFVLKHYSYFYI